MATTLKKKMTITEMAKKAGVSKTVISAICNNKDNQKIFVSGKKKREILDLIEKYGYRPRKSARELASQKTNTIGLIFHRLTPYFSLLVEELQRQAFEKELEIMPYITEGDAEREEEYLSLMRDGRVDGIIIAAFTEGSPARYTKFSSPPDNFKILTISPPVENIPSVHFNEEKAGELAAAHLIAGGCRKLCFFGGDEESGRGKSFLSYIEQRKLPPPLIFTGGEFIAYFPEGKRLAREFLDLRELPDGVFAYNDLLAIALLSELSEKGMRCPGDMAIVSCDNTEICLYPYPALTGIDTNVSP